MAIYSRNQRSFNKRFPEIVRSLEALGDEAVLDGEVVALDDEGKSRFEWLVNPKGRKGSWFTTCLTCCIWMVMT